MLVRKFGANFAHRVKAARREPGGTWHPDEMFLTLRGEPDLLWRAVDQRGAELDILLQKRCDKAATKRFFKRVLRSYPVPREIVIDQLRSYPAATVEIPDLANVKHVHVFVKAAAWLNSRAENSHQPTRERERVCVVFVNANARKLFCRALVRSDSTLRSSDICFVLRCIANNLANALLCGIGSPNSLKIRRLVSGRVALILTFV